MNKVLVLLLAVFSFQVGNAYSQSFEQDRLYGNPNTLSEMESAGIASAIAHGYHQYDLSYTGGQVSLTTGWYYGEKALSLGAGKTIGDSVFINGSIAADTLNGSTHGGVAFGLTVKLPK